VLRSLKTMAGRVQRDVERKLTDEGYAERHSQRRRAQHEMAHVMAQTGSALADHPGFWMDPLTGQTRMDLADSGAKTTDTVGLLLAADVKAKAEGLTVEQALRGMGVSGLANIVADKFRATGGC
jgi:hypothetical protein